MTKVLKCPRDGATLTDVSVVTYSCPNCKGVLLDLAKSKIPAFKKIPDFMKEAQPCDLACPLSGKPMEEFKIGTVTVDYCKNSQALWFDQGEYECVKRYGQRENKKETSSSGSLLESVGDAVADASIEGVVELVLDGLGSVVGSILD